MIDEFYLFLDLLREMLDIEKRRINRINGNILNEKKSWLLIICSGFKGEFFSKRYIQIDINPKIS